MESIAGVLSLNVLGDSGLSALNDKSLPYGNALIITGIFRKPDATKEDKEQALSIGCSSRNRAECIEKIKKLASAIKGRSLGLTNDKPKEFQHVPEFSIERRDEKREALQKIKADAVSLGEKIEPYMQGQMDLMDYLYQSTAEDIEVERLAWETANKVALESAVSNVKPE
jgi:hypothetical protein